MQEPLTPPDCDLRGLEYMPLLTSRERRAYSASIPKGMERRNSDGNAAGHIRQSCGFFASGHPVMAGRAANTIPERGICPLGVTRVSNLPAALPDARRNAPTRQLKSRNGAFAMNTSIKNSPVIRPRNLDAIDVASSRITQAIAFLDAMMLASTCDGSVLSRDTVTNSLWAVRSLLEQASTAVEEA